MMLYKVKRKPLRYHFWKVAYKVSSALWIFFWNWRDYTAAKLEKTRWWQYD